MPKGLLTASNLHPQQASYRIGARNVGSWLVDLYCSEKKKILPRSRARLALWNGELKYDGRAHRARCSKNPSNYFGCEVASSSMGKPCA